MLQTLAFTLAIQAPRERVWDRLIDPDGYRDWTSAFCEGSHFQGSWEAGGRIHFLSPSGDGMCSTVTEHRRPERLVIQHLGEIRQGVEDLSSPEVLAWAPAHETYAFTETPGGCTVTVTLETLPDYVTYMEAAFPKALRRLKDLSERNPA